MKNKFAELNQLTICFIYLKLSGHVSWSWGFVIIPTIVKIVIDWRENRDEW